ncbi:MAG: glycosyltransferase family 4 protein [Candidatus Rokuibacteriota bacterium]
MKVLIISRPFVFHGGVERATLGLVEALVAHGHAVELLTPPGQQPVRGVVKRTLALPPMLPSAARALALAIAARLAVRDGGWDVVQSHERTLRQDVYRAGEGCHLGYLAALGRSGGRFARHRVVIGLERRVFDATPQIVAISEAGRAEIARLYGVPDARLAVVYNGVDLERFHPRNRQARRDAARVEAGVPAGVWVALFVGSGFERKGLATAVEGFARFGDRASRLVVLGRGNTRPYRALAARLGVGERVHWLAPRPDIERWYAAADALVLPTRYEPFGNVHLEALASGLPVITTSRAGGAEALSARSGVVVEPDAPRAVTEALERIRSGDAGEWSRAARAAAEPFTYARQVAGFERVWARVRAAKGDCS